MKLLLDENLSDRLVAGLADLYPDTVHAKHCGLLHAADLTVWDFAKQNGCIIVSKDWDFHQLSLLHGFPPKVVYLDAGNCPTKVIQQLLRDKAGEIASFSQDPVESILVLRK